MAAVPNPHRLYPMLIRPLREADARTGLLERFLRGPQQLADDLWLRVAGLRDLMDYRRTPAAYLPYLARTVGLTGRDLDQMNLSDAELRGLISAAVGLWKVKGTAGALARAARVLTGRTARIISWFDRRTVLDEIYVDGEEAGGAFAVWEEPGGALHEEYTAHVYLMDDGDVNRPAVEYLLELLRPVSERLDLFYCAFLDTQGDRELNWAPGTAGSFTVGADGVRSLVSPGALRTLSPLATLRGDWVNYTLLLDAARATAGTVLEVGVLADDDAGADSLVASFDGTTLTMIHRSGGLDSILAAGIPAVLLPGIYYTVRVEAEAYAVMAGGGTRSFAVFLDGVPLDERTVVATALPGTVVLGCVDGEVLFRNATVLERPVTVVRVGPSP